MRVAVIGAGAVGGWVAARLALAGEQVMAMSSRGPIRRIELTEDGETTSVDFARFDGATEMLMIAVKAPALADAAEAARPLIRADTIVLPMLNGVPWWFTDEPLHCVDPDNRIALALSASQVIGTVVHAACNRPAPDHVIVTHADKILIGEPGGETSERLAELFAMFEQAGLKPDMTGNVRRAIW